MVKTVVAWFLALSLLAVAGFYSYRQLPCRKPVAYSVEQVDGRFRMTPEEFARAVETAETLWENATGRRLFRRVATGGLVIGAVYDNRQEARQKLEEIGLRLDQGKDAYAAFRAAYEEKRAAYEKLRTAYDALEVRYRRERADYDGDLLAVQSRGAGEGDLARLEDKRRSVNLLAADLNARQGGLRNAVDEVNAIVGMLRRTAEQENLSLEEYQDVGATIGDEYEAGVYERSWGRQHITVYAFSERTELIRLLAHEMGHALGLGHIPDPTAVMYRLNQFGAIALSSSDVAALQEQCALAPRLWERVKEAFGA